MFKRGDLVTLAPGVRASDVIDNMRITSSMFNILHLKSCKVDEISITGNIRLKDFIFHHILLLKHLKLV